MLSEKEWIIADWVKEFGKGPGDLDRCSSTVRVHEVSLFKLLAENVRLREQVTALQAASTDVVIDRRALARVREFVEYFGNDYAQCDLPSPLMKIIAQARELVR